MPKTNHDKAVYVTRCEYCGDEHHRLTPYLPDECDRCGRSHFSDRIIIDPHPETLRRARSETPVVNQDDDE